MTHETRPAESAPTRQVLATLRPQTFGKGSPQRISDPIVEPLWTGVRALAGVDGDGATLVDADGDAIEGMDAVVEALAAGMQADGLVLDGFLTRQPLHGAGGVYAWSDEA